MTEEKIPFDIIPISDVSRDVRETRGFSTHELLIRPGIHAADLTLVKVAQSEAAVEKPETTTDSKGWNGSIKNDKYLIALDPNLVGLVMVTDVVDDLSLWFRLNVFYYNATGHRGLKVEISFCKIMIFLGIP